jgi:hypothetical protein
MTQQLIALIADLKATKQALIDNGRCAKGARNDDGNICIALAMSRGVDNLSPEALLENKEAKEFRYDRFTLVQRALEAHLPSHHHGLISFNEDPKTTDQDVYNLIDKALAEAGGMV